MRSTEQSPPPPAVALAVSGTPKNGVKCPACEDWGTVVILRGQTSYEVPCPKACETAQRVQKLRNGEGP